MMKALCFIAALIVTTQTYANDAAPSYFNVWSIGGSASSNTRVLDGFEFDVAPYATAWGGRSIQNDFGYYFGVAIPFQTDEFDYTYTILNGGITYSIGPNIIVYSGVGYSFEEARVRGYWGEVYRTTKNNDQANLNSGIVITGQRFGVNVGYDTASRQISIGIATRF